ncbi:hypothetical protein PLICRDRAFT_33684 [Plicaturopsis crispa FD-325 SS-3]|nr:hypothetical protein PLICRDRAFT_33684 [Plicaturopsis crispa FD-325 SS-3]
MAPNPNSAMTLSIRRAAPSDAPALSHVCLLTADAGSSAQHLHSIPQLPGLIYAEPYVKLPKTTFAFVLVDEFRVVGYIVGSEDSRAFEREAEKHWYPSLREKYPLPGEGSDADEASQLTENDLRYLKLIQKMYVLPEPCISFSPAHLHINILPEYQRRGWGRRLIAQAVDYLRGEGLDGVWLGMDPRNLSAQGFYEKLGFRPIEGAPAGNMGLRFEDWV